MKKIEGPKQIFGPNKILGLKMNFVSEKKFLVQKILVPNIKRFCVTIRFLACSDITDFGGVLLVLVLVVTGVKQNQL